jgi:hypothetical protein
MRIDRPKCEVELHQYEVSQRERELIGGAEAAASP